MKKKNILMIALSLCLVAIIAVGGTFAYFTDSTDTKANVFTLGLVDIELHDESTDPKLDPSAGTDDGLTYVDVLPGDTLDKDVYVTVNKDSSDAYVGIFVTVESDNDNYSVAGLVSDAMMRAGTMMNWNSYFAEHDGKEGILYVYKDVVSSDGVEDVRLDLFTDICIPDSWGNDFAESTFSISVQAFAVQADHFTEAKFCDMVNGLLTDDNGNVIEFEVA